MPKQLCNVSLAKPQIITKDIGYIVAYSERLVCIPVLCAGYLKHRLLAHL